MLDGEGEIAGATTDTSLREQGRFRAKRGDLDKLAKVTFNIDPSTPRLILSTFEEPLYCAQFLDRTVSTMMSNLHQTLGWEDETVALQLSLGWFYGGDCREIYALLHGNTIVAGESASGIAERFLTTQPTVIVSGPSYISAVTDAWSETLQNRDHEGDLRTFGDLFRAMGATAIGAKIRKDIHDRFGKAIRTVYVVDAPVPDGVNDVFQTANVDALTMWGTPETGISHAEIDGAVRSGSVGRPVYGVAMNLKKTKTGDVGPIQIRSEAAMDGYWKVDGEAELEDDWLTLPITGSITNGFLVLGRLEPEAVGDLFGRPVP